ncbi:7-carboxy-7-deazaguanine synthase QueE [Duncaniella muris]|uniref:7-carboxy-7-deazaguanine synthase QueE n=1 Tax=Duncaniella muris TaxID=2094150 RepID=UPI002674C7C5|nr:radical SAM protein [Duncaniella muris]
MSYRINEIFYSLQGEGYFTGTPAVFLRMSGCNLKCGFCDTRHEEHTLMSPAQIVEAIGQYPTRHIIITGGEPSLQLDQMLVDLLHDEGWFIQIETNGTNPLPEGIDWVTCSPKQGPGGEIAVRLRNIDELKVVYEGQDVESIANSLPAMHYFLQPCSSPRYDGGSNTAATVSYILAHPHWRLSLQTHKLIDIQ